SHFFFILQFSGAHCCLLSFLTRRSSDLSLKYRSSGDPLRAALYPTVCIASIVISLAVLVANNLAVETSRIHFFSFSMRLAARYTINFAASTFVAISANVNIDVVLAQANVVPILVYTHKPLPQSPVPAPLFQSCRHLSSPSQYESLGLPLLIVG